MFYKNLGGYYMLKTRLNGTETAMDKAIKLAGKKNPIAQGILNKALVYSNPMENIYMGMIDQLGLYGRRIEFLYKACESDIDKFLDAVNTFHEKAVSQDRIIAMKTQEEFDVLVKEYQ